MRGLLFHANPASTGRKVVYSLSPSLFDNLITRFFCFKPNSTRNDRFGDKQYVTNFGRKRRLGRKTSSLGDEALIKKLRNVRTGVKQGDFRVLSEKSRTVWRERPKQTRDQFVLYCLARTRFASGRLAPNTKVMDCLARTFFADLAP